MREFVTVGGYALLLLSGWPFPIAFVVMLAAIVALAVLTERFAFRPLRSADAATLLISSFAVSMFLQKLLIFAVGSRPKALDPLPALSTPLWIGGVQLSSLKLVIILVCALALGGLTLFLRKTRYGLQMRAAAEDFTMSRLVGVRANLVIALAFALSGGLAAIVAPLFVAEAGFVQPRFGVQIVIVAFVATVIGGLGSLEGAVVGGIPRRGRVHVAANLPAAGPAAFPRGFRVSGCHPGSARAAAGSAAGARAEGAGVMSALLRRSTTLVVLAAIVVAIAVLAQYGGVVTQRRVILGLIDLVAVVALYVFMGNSGVHDFRLRRLHGDRRLCVGVD